MADQKIFLILLVLAILAGGIWYYSTQQKSSNMENFEDAVANEMKTPAAEEETEEKTEGDNTIMTQASTSGAEPFENQGDADMMPQQSQQLSAQDLLPSDANSSQWAQVYPSGEGKLKDRNFLQAGYHIGINTVGQTLRNANLQLRSEPPAPQVKVSPWLQSTIEPDLGRKPFEIGGCA
jgi:hypothetical protein